MASPVRSRKILLIEDNCDFTYLLCSLLTLMGYECIPAYNGNDGLKKAKEIKPDIIFCDIGLPDMDGFEVARRIRKDALLKNVYIVALTGYAIGGLDHAVDSGFNAFLIKPVSMTDIEKILDKI